MSNALTVTGAMPGYTGYSVEDSGATVQEIFAACNREMYLNYGLLRAGEAPRPVAYPLMAYRQLIASLAAMERIECVTLGALCRRPMSEGRVRLAIRHDVDGDIVAAELGAEIEAEFGVPSSYYFLHTAYYHGRFEGERFLRHGCMGHVYRRIQELGHEVGLHTNGLEVYRGTVAGMERGGETARVDGAMSVAAEIAWMRSIKLSVTGTVGHGSKAVFGAENFEIFKGRAKGRARVEGALDEPELVEHGGRRAWTHVLDETALGLEYEGNDVHWAMRSKVEYGATRTVDGWRWNRRFDRDAAGMLAFCSQEAMLADIARLEPGCCVVLTIHPCYYGCRHRPDSAPVLRLDRRTTVVLPGLGWRGWEPGSVVAVHEPDEDPRLERQSLAFANEYGMIDRAWAEGGRTTRRVLFLDGAAMADPAISPETNAGRIASGAIDAGCALLAHPRMGSARLFGWLSWAMERWAPTDVVIGVGTLEPAWSMGPIWSEISGLSVHHPAGDCLVPGPKGDPMVRGRSEGWAVRQRDARERAFWPGTQTRLERAMMERRGPRVDGVDALVFAGACVGRCAALAREGGCRVFLALTDDGAAYGDEALMAGYRATAGAWAASAGAELIDATAAIAALADEGISPIRRGGGLSVDGHRVLGAAMAASLSRAGS